jgi:hypothetical protein
MEVQMAWIDAELVRELTVRELLVLVRAEDLQDTEPQRVT